MLEIVQRLAEEGYQIEPEALELIASHPDSWEELVERLISGLGCSAAVIGVSDVVRASSEPIQDVSVSQDPPSRTDPASKSASSSGPSAKVASHHRKPSFRSPEGNGSLGKPMVGEMHEDRIRRVRASSLSQPGSAAKAAGRSLDGGPVSVRSVSDETSAATSGLEILGDITGNSTCVGEYGDFVRYFRDRYAKIREILSGRLNVRPIESLGKTSAGREISVIGMVMETRTSAKGNKVVLLEDPTGMVTAIFKKGTSPFEDAVSLVSDEVIGVTGTTDGGGMIFVNSLTRPDLQDRSLPVTGEGGALLLSDLHVGSKHFMEEAWQRFSLWINGEMDDPLELASKVRYVVIAGDLVDGVGVYPGQEGDLSIMDIHRQYERSAELLSEIPERIRIVVAPGNHDAVRQAEPQPALPESIQGLFGKNVTFVGNPAWFKLGGIDWLVYHGRSIDDLVLRIPGLSYSEPEKAMVEMLKRRHLSPIYGNRVSIAPEQEDLLVVQRPPAVLHCGHVHTFGVTRYKGVTVVNSGTWQAQTDFQKKMNIQPTAAIVPYLDLESMRIRKLIFA